MDKEKSLEVLVSEQTFYKLLQDVVVGMKGTTQYTAYASYIKSMLSEVSVYQKLGCVLHYYVNPDTLEFRYEAFEKDNIGFKVK